MIKWNLAATVLAGVACISCGTYQGGLSRHVDPAEAPQVLSLSTGDGAAQVATETSLGTDEPKVLGRDTFVPHRWASKGAAAASGASETAARFGTRFEPYRWNAPAELKRWMWTDTTVRDDEPVNATDE